MSVDPGCSLKVVCCLHSRRLCERVCIGCMQGFTGPCSRVFIKFNMDRAHRWPGESCCKTAWALVSSPNQTLVFTSLLRLCLCFPAIAKQSCYLVTAPCHVQTGACVGIFTERDFLKAGVGNKCLTATTVAEVMTPRDRMKTVNRTSLPILSLSDRCVHTSIPTYVSSRSTLPTTSGK